MRHWSLILRCIDLLVLDWSLLDLCSRADLGLVELVVTGVVNLVENRWVDISGGILLRAPQAEIIDTSLQFRRLQVYQCRPRLLEN